MNEIKKSVIVDQRRDRGRKRRQGMPEEKRRRKKKKIVVRMKGAREMNSLYLEKTIDIV